MKCPATSAVSFVAAKGLVRKQLRQLLSSDFGFGGSADAKRIVRLEVPVTGCTPLVWLSAQTHPVQMYWSDRQLSFEMASIGYVDKVSCNPEKGDIFGVNALTQKLGRAMGDARYYGGLRFGNPACPEQHWLPYGAGFFLLPQFELYTNATGTYFACNVYIHTLRQVRQQLYTALSLLEQMDNYPNPSAHPPDILTMTRQDSPDRAGWCDGVEAALDLLRAGAVDKIVLGRSTLLSFAVAPTAVELLSRLKVLEPNAYHFYIQPEAGYGFIGATPERLYKRQRSFIESEAVAGTCPRGTTLAEDNVLGAMLLGAEKERREHLMVRNDVRVALATCCYNLMISQEPRLLKQSRVQHLYSTLNGQLQHTISDLDLLRLLHPTPAVGGLPKDRALQAIAELEPFDRGWFAGPVGWIGSDAAEFAVGIRSAMLNGASIRLFAGAGVVEGSVPQLEWDELETKISIFMDALGLSRKVEFHAVGD